MEQLESHDSIFSTPRCLLLHTDGAMPILTVLSTLRKCPEKKTYWSAMRSEASNLETQISISLKLRKERRGEGHRKRSGRSCKQRVCPQCFPCPLLSSCSLIPCFALLSTANMQQDKEQLKKRGGGGERASPPFFCFHSRGGTWYLQPNLYRHKNTSQKIFNRKLVYHSGLKTTITEL